MSDYSEESDSDLPLEVREAAAAANQELIPEESKEKYQAEYDRFLSWKSSKKLNSINEMVLQAYFKKLSEQYSPNTLWAKYSMLRATLFAHNDIDLKTFEKLIPFIKRKNLGYEPKKSKVFTSDELMKFFTTSSDQDWLHVKVSLRNFIKKYF